MYRRLFALALRFALAAMPITSNADGFSMFSKHEALKAHVVADAGDFEKLDALGSSFGAAEILKLNSNCFSTVESLGLWGFGKKAGLVLVDKDRAIRLALLESSVGSIKVETVQATQIACPTQESSTLSSDPQKRLEQLKQQQEVLKRQLEQIIQLQKQRERLRLQQKE